MRVARLRQSCVDGCRPSLFGDEPCAAERAMVREGGLQLGGLPCPVHHVRAGNVDEGVRRLALPRVPQDVVEVVGTVQAEGDVGIAGAAVAAGMHQVVVEYQIVGDDRFVGVLHPPRFRPVVASSRFAVRIWRVTDPRFPDGPEDQIAFKHSQVTEPASAEFPLLKSR